MPTPLPLCNALLICDVAHQDPQTRKFTIVGTFNTIRARQFPATHPRMAFFCELKNGHGVTPVTIKLVRTTADHPDGEALLTVDAEVHFASPRDCEATSFGVDNLTFPEPGEYRLIVESSGRLISERTITLIRVE